MIHCFTETSEWKKGHWQKTYTGKGLAYCKYGVLFTFNTPTRSVTGRASMSTWAPEFSWSLRAFRFLLLHETLKTPSVNGPFLNNNRSISCWRTKNMRSLRNRNLPPTKRWKLESKNCPVYFLKYTFLVLCMIHQWMLFQRKRQMYVFIIFHQNDSVHVWNNFPFRMTSRQLHFFLHDISLQGLFGKDSIKTTKPSAALAMF